MAAYLATFRLPEETAAQAIRLYERVNGQRKDADQRRLEISNRIERIAEKYTWGDLTRDAYRADREYREFELSTLRGDGSGGRLDPVSGAPA